MNESGIVMGWLRQHGMKGNKNSVLKIVNLVLFKMKIGQLFYFWIFFPSKFNYLSNKLIFLVSFTNFYYSIVLVESILLYLIC